MVERKLNYYMKIILSEQDLMKYFWTLAILNKPIEIQRIEQRFF